MEIQDQVCSFDQAALIYSYGLRLDTIFWWCQEKDTENNIIVPSCELDQEMPDLVKMFPVPTVAELGVLLGYRYRVELYDGSTLAVDQIKYGLFSKELMFYIGDYQNLTEAQARAEALIWLIENKHLKPENLKL